MFPEGKFPQTVKHNPCSSFCFYFSNSFQSLQFLDGIQKRCTWWIPETCNFHRALSLISTNLFRPCCWSQTELGIMYGDFKTLNEVIKTVYL